MEEQNIYNQSSCFLADMRQKNKSQVQSMIKKNARAEIYGIEFKTKIVKNQWDEMKPEYLKRYTGQLNLYRRH